MTLSLSLPHLFAALTIVMLSALPALPQSTGGTTDAAEAQDDWYRAPAQGGVRRWQVAQMGGIAARATADAGGRMVRAFNEGAVLSSFGCSDVDGKVWCEIRSFRGGARGFLPASALAPAQGRDGLVAMGKDDSRKRADRGSFDSTTEASCAQERGHPLGLCRIGVARGTGGDATVVATFKNGFSRKLYFVHGEFVSANTTMSGNGTDIDWKLVAGVHLIRVDDQRFELSDAFVFGE